MEKCDKVAALYINTLRAMGIIHTTSHWLTRGITFYGDHLLFERIYNTTLEHLDMAAEKYVAIFGDQVLDYDLQIDLLSKILKKYSNLEGSPIEMSLAIEKDFQQLSKDTFKCFDDEGKLTLGVDDMLASIANKREEAIYLLQQCLKGHK